MRPVEASEDGAARPDAGYSHTVRYVDNGAAWCSHVQADRVPSHSLNLRDADKRRPMEAQALVLKLVYQTRAQRQ